MHLNKSTSVARTHLEQGNSMPMHEVFLRERDGQRIMLGTRVLFRLLYQKCLVTYTCIKSRRIFETVYHSLYFKVIPRQDNYS
jgi:hypothetical protein